MKQAFNWLVFVWKDFAMYWAEAILNFITCSFINVSPFAIDETWHPGYRTEITAIQSMGYFILVSSDIITVYHLYVNLK